jgi:ectoine hydroxylase-related dioxygenase (phytanoyl-CoA dioxygenase family)
MVSSETKRAVLPTDDDVAFYREHGYWFSPVIVAPEVLDAAERGMARFYRGHLDRELTSRDGASLGGWSPDQGEDVLRKNDYSSLRVGELFALVSSPLIAACAARLAGVDALRLWHDQLLYKPVDAPETVGNVGWHTDRQYWRTCTSEDMLTAWVPFHDVDDVGGTVSFIDGSHRWRSEGNDFFNIEGAAFWNQDLDVDALGATTPPRAVPAVLRRGQVSFHNCKTIHGSGPNRSGRPRRVLTVHLQPGDNAYHRTIRPDGSEATHTNDGLCALVDGRPDYSDPAWFPQLWPTGSA